MTATIDHVDGLLPHDLAIFTEILTRHGRATTLRRDIETLVDARFTTEMLQAYDTHWGNSPDFTPTSLIRLAQDHITPSLAQAALERGNLTANDAIRDIEEFLSQAQRAGIDPDTALSAYQAHTPHDQLANHTTSTLQEALLLRGNHPITLPQVLALTQLIAPNSTTPARFHALLENTLGHVGGYTADELINQLRSAQTSYDQLRAERLFYPPIDELLNPATLHAARTTATPLARVLEIACAAPYAPDIVEAAIRSGSTLNAHALTRTIATAADHDIDVPEALERYHALDYLPEENRPDAIPHISTPGAHAALRALTAANPPGSDGLPFADLTTVAAELSDLDPTSAHAIAQTAITLTLDTRQEVHVESREPRRPTTPLGSVAKLAKTLGAATLERHADTLRELMPLTPKQAAYLLVDAHEQNVAVTALAHFLKDCPQVAPEVLTTLAAHNVDPVLFQAILRAAPLEPLRVHSSIYHAIEQAGIPHELAAERIRTTSNGNAHADPYALIAGALGSEQLLHGDWDACELTEALLALDPATYQLQPPEWAKRHQHHHSLGWPNPKSLPHTYEHQFELNSRWWTRTRAITEPAQTYTNTPQHQDLADALVTWRTAVFPDHGTPQLTSEDLTGLQRQLDSYLWERSRRWPKLNPEHGATDPRWADLRRKMLQDELATPHPDYALLATLVSPTVTYNPNRSAGVNNRKDLELLSALTLHYPDLGPRELLSVVTDARTLNSHDPAYGQRKYEIPRTSPHGTQIGPALQRIARPLPDTAQLDAAYVSTFAQAHPTVGATMMLLNFLTGHSADTLPRSVSSLTGHPTTVGLILRSGQVTARDADGHTRTYLETGSEIYEYSRGLGLRTLSADNHILRQPGERHRPYTYTEVLTSLTPADSTPAISAATSRRSTPHEALPLAAHSADSIAAHCARIGKVVDWYAGILIDPLQAGWTAENAPAIIDRRSSIFAELEGALVTLQDHPLMRGTVDPDALGELGQQAAPPDFAKLTHTLETTMHQAWADATQAGTTYDIREVDTSAQHKLDELQARHAAVQLQAESLGLLATAQALRLEPPGTPEGAAKHAKAQALEERARALDAEATSKERYAATLARGTDDIVRRLHTLSTSPLLAGTPQLSELPHLKELTNRHVGQLEPGNPRGPRVTPQPARRGAERENLRRDTHRKDTHASILG